MSKALAGEKPARAAGSRERPAKDPSVPGFGSGGKRSMLVGWAVRAFPSLGQLPEPLESLEHEGAGPVGIVSSGCYLWACTCVSGHLRV